MSLFEDSQHHPERTLEQKKSLFRSQTGVFAVQTRAELRRRYEDACERIFGEHPEGLSIKERADALGELLPEALQTARLIKEAVNAASPGHIPGDYIEQTYGITYTYTPEDGLVVTPVSD